MKKNDCFVAISNQQIYEKLIQIERKLEIVKSSTKINRWISTTALGLVCILIGVIIEAL